MKKFCEVFTQEIYSIEIYKCLTIRDIYLAFPT